jgi:PBSX family phage terminase large subunit
VRSGKTWCLHPKALYCCAYHVGGRNVFTGVSKQSVYNNVLADLFDLVGPRNYCYNRNTGQLKLYGTEWLVIGAKDEGSERYVRGLTVGIAICDELSLMPQSFFQMLLTRMSPEGARLYATTNPDSPYHWLKTDYLDNVDLRSKNILWSDHFTMADNPNLSPEFLEAQKRLYRGFFYKRFIEGLWVIAEGAIYKDSWSEELLYDQPDEPIGLRGPGGYQQRIIAVDYGTTNPMVFLDIYDDGRLFWVTREYYWDSVVEMRQKTDAEYADDLVKFIGPHANAKVIIDPSAASFKAEMLKRGIWHVDADNDVNEGIRITSMVLNQRLVRFCRQAASKTIQQMQTYAWDAKAAQRGEERPLKVHDHGPDAFRYFAKSEVPYWRLACD